MIEIINKFDCCGCGACAQSCPKQCIAMQSDEEGFLYPKVDNSIISLLYSYVKLSFRLLGCFSNVRTSVE